MSRSSIPTKKVTKQLNYSIAAIAEASGFNHVRTLQRRIMDVTGMTPADYRALFTRDM